MSLSPADKAIFERDGFVTLRSVFSAAEIADLVAETDALLVDSDSRISQFNLRCRYMPHWQSGELLFEVFDPINEIAPRCEQMTRDRRIVGLIESIYGEPCCLFKEKFIFKPAGATGYKLHQDIPFGWVGFPRTFLTVLVAIDPSSPENGCTEVFSGYHHSFLSNALETYMLPDEMVDNSRRTFLALEPGDVAIFHGLTPHRSEPNRSDRMRRSFYISYNAASDGGDQRTAHYAEFHQRMRGRRPVEEQPLVFFR